MGTPGHFNRAMTSSKPSPPDVHRRSSPVRIPSPTHPAHTSRNRTGRPTAADADTIINDVTPGQRNIYRIRAGSLFDSVARVLVPHQLITVDGSSGIVLDVCAQADAREVNELLAGLEPVFGAQWAEKPVNVVEIDMSALTVLPGMIDVHVHCECSCSSICAHSLTRWARSFPAPICRDVVGAAADRGEPGRAHGARDGACAKHPARGVHHRARSRHRGRVRRRRWATQVPCRAGRHHPRAALLLRHPRYQLHGRIWCVRHLTAAHYYPLIASRSEEHAVSCAGRD